MKIKVLAVDDDSQGLLAIGAALDGVDAELITATSGDEALRLLLAEEDYAVILLDVLMPGLDGLETAALIRERERSRYTPIIFLTGASLDNRHKELGYAAGAVDYMYKPIEPWILRSKVEVFVELARKAAMVNDLARKQAQLLADLAANNAQLIEARARAERESRYKTTFLSTVSHELRTPLNAIIGFSEVLLRGFLGEVPERHTDALTAVHKSGQHLLTLINDILDVSKIEAGKLQLSREHVALRELIASVFEIVRGLSVDRGVGLEWTGPEADLHVSADPVRLKQILFNLLSNGLKNVDRGGYVRLTASASGSDLILAVADNGVGISEDDQRLLFLPFQQLGTEARQAGEGTGLGLSLTKRLVQLHGGRIEVSSELGRGSTFTVTMPIVANSDIADLDLAQPKMLRTLELAVSPARIAIIDDNETNRRLIRTILGVRGHDVLEASCVEDGIDLVERTSPDLALLDIQMPDGGGARILEAIRRSDTLAGIPVVAITAYAMKGDRERFLSAGFDDYIPKPVDPDRLFGVVESYLGR